jgi:hypothetical protein
MNEGQKRQFDSLHALSEQAWREWDHKTRHEWKLSFAIWTAILVALGTAIKVEDFPVPIEWVMLCGIVLLILHITFLRWVRLKLRDYRQKLHNYREQMHKLSGSSVKEDPFISQPWYKQASSLWTQAGITLLLVCLLVVVGSDNADLPSLTGYKILVSLAYVLVVCGSIGMIIFATKFPLSSRNKDLRHSEERFLGLNGYQVWLYSWLLIILGTIMQLIYSLL